MLSWLWFVGKDRFRRRKMGKTFLRYLLQGQSARLKHWFDIDIDWFEGNFITGKPQFYKRLFQSNIEVQAG